MWHSLDFSLTFFGDFADGFILVNSYLADSDRVDVLFDRYLPDSIKNGTRIKRARGTKFIRRIIERRAAKLPDNWNSFISAPENKAKFAHFLSGKLVKTIANGEVITGGEFNNVDYTASNQNNVLDLSAIHKRLPLG